MEKSADTRRENQSPIFGKTFRENQGSIRHELQPPENRHSARHFGRNWIGNPDHLRKGQLGPMERAIRNRSCPGYREASLGME